MIRWLWAMQRLANCYLYLYWYAFVWVCGEKPFVYSGFVVVHAKTAHDHHSNETAFEQVWYEIRVLQKRSMKTLALVGVAARLRLFWIYEHERMYIYIYNYKHTCTNRRPANIKYRSRFRSCFSDTTTNEITRKGKHQRAM